MRPERFSASVASKHVACHASANLELAIPDITLPGPSEDTAASARGTAMHLILEQAGEYTARQMLGIAEAMGYVAELRMKRRFKVMNEASGTGWWLTDTPRTKADVVLYLADEIHVVDYKFGTIPVAASGNSQGMYYALAFAPLAPKAKGVWFHIVQPFAKNIEAVFFTAAELEQFKQETIAADVAIQAGSTKFGPSDSCMFCPANPHGRGTKADKFCPAMLSMLYPIVVDEDAILADE
mgnify:CR=1 FL=1